MLVAQQQRAAPPLLLPTSKRQRVGTDRNAGGSVKRWQLGVVVAPLIQMALVSTIVTYVLKKKVMLILLLISNFVYCCFLYLRGSILDIYSKGH